MSGADEQVISDEPDASPVAPPPRPITAGARKRSWSEAPVRLWVVLSILVALITGYFVVTRTATGLRERRLIAHGVQVTAVVEAIDGFDLHKRDFLRDQARMVRLHYDGPDGKRYKDEIVFPPEPDKKIHVDDRVTLRVDPDDPTIMTPLSTPEPWFQKLFVVLMLAPLLLILLLMVTFRRAGILKIWRDGVAAPAVVLGTDRVAIAPRSQLLRLTLRDGEDRRIFTVLHPTATGTIEKGDEIWVVHADKNVGRAVVARLYG
ncbi:MAG: hypothetical protein ACREJC_13900 [Tepidisphaeraceae bacterium]